MRYNEYTGEYDIPEPPEVWDGSAAFGKHAFYLAVYEVDRAYGGPEEGGWWYDTGTLRVIHGPYMSLAAAQGERERVAMLYPSDSKYGSSSMAYDGGEYRVWVEQGIPAPYFPSETPHYE